MASGGKTKKPRPPSSVTVGGRRIRVLMRCMGDEDWGEYKHDDSQILLNADMIESAEDLRVTLRHEMMEAALYVSGAAWMNRYDQEPVVRAMEEIFFPAWERVEHKLMT